MSECPLISDDQAIKDARYRQEITPRKRETTASTTTLGSPGARSRWRHFSKIARHAHGSTEDPDLEAVSSADIVSPNGETRPLSQGSVSSTTWQGKIMGLPYFLEMVDQKHRYGSNLRQYHAEWLKADTHENFFYWLDHGDGRNVEIERVSRHRLEKEQVRYLSREERLTYLVVIDGEGKLCWNKDGLRIDTTPEWKDSLEGIVSLESHAKTFREDEIRALEQKAAESRGDKTTSDDAHSSSAGSSSGSASDAERRYPDPDDFQKARGVTKVTHVSVDTIMNRLLRKSVKKKTWIFVVDTSMNLYVGIKQSGSFQHSSFMRGSRISSAGQIKIKRGQLRSLSPLSGHYQPPLAAFRHFVQHLHEAGVDMSRVSISKSYAVLLGLEAYLGGKTRVHKAEKGIKEGVERIVHPAEAKARREAAKDLSQSARLEEEHRRRQQQQQQQQSALSWRGRMATGLTGRVRSMKVDDGSYDDSQITTMRRPPTAGTAEPTAESSTPHGPGLPDGEVPSLKSTTVTDGTKSRQGAAKPPGPHASPV